VGEVCSAATVAAAGVASTAQIPLISPAATSPSLSDKDMFFRTVPSDKFQGQAGADLAHKKGFRNVAMVYEDAAYGWGLAFNFIAAFTKSEWRCSGLCLNPPRVAVDAGLLCCPGARSLV
jgi:ABC-type branched-subunit amino acid transport system substrate-binding protein